MPAKTAEKTGEDKVTAARNKNLDLAIQQIAKDYGDGAIMRLGDEKIVDIDVIPTGNILIDRALGVGGFPRGRVVEVFGPESSGKTTLTLTVILRGFTCSALGNLSVRMPCSMRAEIFDVSMLGSSSNMRRKFSERDSRWTNVPSISGNDRRPMILSSLFSTEISSPSLFTPGISTFNR